MPAKDDPFRTHLGSGPASAPGEALLADLERFKPDGMTLNGWAVSAGVSRAVWGDIRRHGNPSRRTLEKLLIAAQSSLAEFEALRVGAPMSGSPAYPSPAALSDPRSRWRTGPMDSLQASPTSPAGHLEGAQAVVPLFEMAGPPDNHRFSMPVCVANMEPRFRVGRMIVVDPRSPCRPGDDVLVGLRPDTAGSPVGRFFMAHLAQSTDRRMTLRQYSPPGDFDFLVDSAASINRILGEAF